MYVCVCACAGTHTHVSQVEVRGQFAGVDSFWGSISSSQRGSQALLSTEPSHSPTVNFQHGNVKQHHRTCMLYNHYNEVMWCKHMFLQKKKMIISADFLSNYRKRFFFQLFTGKSTTKGGKNRETTALNFRQPNASP